MKSWYILFVNMCSVFCDDESVTPGIGQEYTALQVSYWRKYPQTELNTISTCVASLRNTINSDYRFGHVQSATIITMDTALTSAKPIQTELRTFRRRGRDLVKERLLKLAHNRFQRRHPQSRTMMYSNVTDIIFYPDRTLRATVDSPSHTRDDLAIVRFATTARKDELCRCNINFVSSLLYYPHWYHVIPTGHSGYKPTDPVQQFAQRGQSQMYSCNNISKFWGHYFCITPYNSSAFRYGPDSGAAVLDYNLTVIGIGSFAFSMGTGGALDLLAYVTDLSHPAYRIWIMQMIYNRTISEEDTQEPDIQRAWQSDCFQWTYHNWSDYEDSTRSIFASIIG